MIEIKNLKKSFNQNHVLRGINLNINDNEIVSVIGSSGGGKSTLLRCLNFLEHGDSGTISIGNANIECSNAKKQEINAIRLKSTMVFQSFNLFKNKTALENIMEPLIVNKILPKAQAKTTALKYLEKVGLENKQNEYPSKLSGGQQQRVGIARALALNPEVILFDEPTSALDPESISDILKLIKEVADEKRTMIIVTHEMNFAREISDRVVYMDKGEIVEEGSPEEIFTNPREERTRQFLARYLQPEYII
ncbi:ABC-type polar amino acid transport system, ATPase component [Treponema sp. JC4]|uniref:amino acid ABC transporter ATP-binding protein n=1 Tax=Treponema sp. JC4 TaxID=1124982 RepID=UPI00025AFB93|nr:amino acid ABC transporter ATP-binding protein [Treponema sp. JC4]EID85832.1 ABC-type polar amino acid transport system, ATPase component [Treponema sp. JC4]